MTCGKPTNEAFAKFCHNCGKPFISNGITAQTTVNNSKKTPIVIVENDEDDDIIPSVAINTESIQVDFEIDNSDLVVKRESIGNLRPPVKGEKIERNLSSNEPVGKRKVSKKKAREAFFEQFKKEAGTLRSK